MSKWMLLPLGLLALSAACNQDLLGRDHAGNDPGEGADMGASSVDEGTEPVPDGGVVISNPDGGTVVCFVTRCQNHTYQCGDCIDNDGDGRIDSQDPDCLGPCDHTENGLHPAIPGANNAPCKQDCFFDQDTGSGNDQCYWDHACDRHEVPPDYHPEGIQCRYDPNTRLGERLTCTEAAQVQSGTCLSFCGPLTPNGCDCFGCCSIGPQARGDRGIWLGSRDESGRPSCTLDALDDPQRCRPCQIVFGCFKPCGRCQLCIGKDRLPPDCFTSGDGGAGGDGGVVVPGQCPPGVQACGLPGQPPCPPQWYCVTGCCAPPLG
ncbi:MAG: hypothetical protein RMK29_00495 [Myxococcales bacterium]|nr:hypothetical protein [Myxococcota bacterium]MDW8280155.1 hypothetical protein [Myxococcales bacterium]